MELYYRISDKSYNKPKLIGATKQVCLMNFLITFKDVIYGDGKPPEGHVPPLRIIADNCDRITIKYINETGLPFAATNDGNAGSLIHSIEAAITTLNDNELVYFCEDDYLHLAHSPKLLEEGIRRADYVSLYDHPDKYTRYYNLGEHCKVIRTPLSHWRTTQSTCMTFASKVKTLKDDLDIWKKFTESDHPHDHHLFTELGQKGRKLIVPIPGAACHTDMTFSGKMNEVLIDDWAIEMMCLHMEAEINEMSRQRKDLLDVVIELGLLGGKGSWEKLVKLDAMRQHLKNKT